MVAGNKIKLVQVIADSKVGGGPKHVLGILKNIDQSKFEVFLVCPPGYLSAEAKLISGVKVFNFNPRSKFDLLAIFRLHKIFEKIRATSNPFGPLIIHSHGPRGGLMARIASPFSSKMVHTEHIFDENYHLKNPINEWIQRYILKRQNKNTDRIIAVSASVNKFLLKSGILESNLSIIPNGIDVKNQRIIAKDKILNKKYPVIGTVGNLNYQKGHIYLIGAIALLKKKYPLITLNIIGEGEDRSILEDEIKKLELEHNVNLLGYRSDVNKEMRKWDVFALSSVSETFGIVVLEAMNNKLPIVATRVGGVEDIVVNKKSGLLVVPRNSRALATAIEEIIEHPVLAAKLKRAGLERVKDFDWKKIIKKLEWEYTRVIG